MLLALFSCNNKSSQSAQESKLSVTVSEQKAVEYLTPKQKSIHLFDLPEGMTERQFVGAVEEINAAIDKLGYPGVGYHVYKVQTDTIQEYRYFMEGLWPDPETYRVIHDSEAWNQAIDENREMFDRAFANQIYRRILKVEGI